MDKRNKKIIEVMGKYSDFVIKFDKFTRGRTTSDMSIWEKIKLFYYITFKYKWLYNDIESCLKGDVDRISKRPENFIEIIASYIYIIETAKYGYPEPEEFVPLLLKNTHATHTLSINSITDQNDRLTKYKVTVFGLSVANVFYQGKACKTILEIDIQRGRYSLDVTVYDLDTIENQESLIDSKILYRKIFQIKPDGTLDNPSFIFDISLEAEEIMKYICCCLFTISPFINVLIGFSSLQFIGFKSEE